jgi:uncharacterized delta-60 repeat protein
VSTKKGGVIDRFALARYNANGTLDTTFGTNGKVTTNGVGGGIGGPNNLGMAVDASGRILVAGKASSAALVRYTPNGALDTSFGTGGFLSSNISSAGVVLQPDGKIVLASALYNPATGTNSFTTDRFNADGTADSTFGSGGVVTTYLPLGGGFGGVTIQGDGKIVVSGTEGGATTNGRYLLRYNPDGSLDATFGTGGTVAVRPPTGSFRNAQGVAVQADGKIIANGRFLDATQNVYFAALRVNPDGSVDTGYGTGGWATAQVPPSGGPNAMALEPDGRLLLAGGDILNPSSGPTDVALVRFLGSAPQVGSFTASPNPVTSGSSITLTASGITDGNPNSTVTQVAFYYIDNTGTKQVLGYGTSDGLGHWTLSITISLPPGSYTLYAQAEDSYGVFGDPFALALTVQ